MTANVTTNAGTIAAVMIAATTIADTTAAALIGRAIDDGVECR